MLTSMYFFITAGLGFVGVGEGMGDPQGSVPKGKSFFLGVDQ